MSMNTCLHIDREKTSIKMGSTGCLMVTAETGNEIMLYANESQLKQIADTITGHLEYLADVKRQEDQLELHFEHQQVLDKVAV